jgi:RNA polymerase sigma factor (sigma-70 family)
MNLVPHSTERAAPANQPASAIAGRVADVDLRLTASSEAEQAFVAVYDALFPRLCRFAERFLSPDDAEEAVQAAMLRIWNDWAVIALDRPGVPFFFHAVRNQIIDARRAAKAQRGVLGEYLYDWTRRSRRDRPDVQLEQAELAGIIDATVAGLPERCREAWVLVRDSSLTYEGAATAMAIAPATAKKHMTFAQRALREALTDAGYREAAIAAAPQRMLPSETKGEDTP